MKTRTLIIFLLASLLQPYTAQSMGFVVNKSEFTMDALYKIVNTLQVQLIVKPEAEWAIPSIGTVSDKDAIFALCFCSSLAHMRKTAFIQAFLDRGAQVNKIIKFQDSGSRTLICPLVMAVGARRCNANGFDSSYLPNLELLLSKGATFCNRQMGFNGPIDIDLANTIEHFQRVMHVNSVNRLAQPPFEHFQQIIIKLIEAGGSLRGISGKPPLIEALAMPVIVKTLLLKGANPFQKVASGRTVSQYAHGICLDIEESIAAGREVDYDHYDKVKQSQRLICDAAGKNERGLEYLPKLAGDHSSYFAKLPPDLRLLVSNYFEYPK